MTKSLALVGVLVVAFAAAAAAQAPASLGTVTIPKKLMADGKPLPAGTYQVRLSNDEVSAAAGETPGAEKWVEFVKGGKAVGREVATVISAQDINSIVKGGKKPASNSASVEMLKGGNYYRVWINRGGTHYLINLPPAA